MHIHDILSFSVSTPRLSVFHFSSETMAFLQYVPPGRTDASLFYYALFQIQVSMTGLYKFRGLSTYDDYGYLYINQFNQSFPEWNLIAYNDDDGSDINFQLSANLAVDTIYYLVFTWLNSYTSDENAVLYVSGPTNVTLQSVNGK